MPSIAFSLPRDLTSLAGWLAVLLPVTAMLGAAAIDIVVVLICCCFLAHSFAEQDFRWLKEPAVAVLGAVWIFTTARTIVADPSFKNVGIAASWIRFPMLAAALGMWVLHDKLWRDRLLFSAVAVCGFLALDGLLQYVVGKDLVGNPIEMGRLTGTIGKPRLGAAIAWMLLPAVFGLVQARAFLAASALAVVSVTTIALSGDRMALLFILAGLTLCSFLTPSVRPYAWKGVLVIAALLAALIFARPDVYHRQVLSTNAAMRDVGKTHYGLIWERTMVMARANVLLGVGFNQYRVKCNDPAYGPVTSFNSNGTACAHHAHNLYLEWLVEGGLLALAGFVGALALIGQRLFKAWPLLRTDAVYIALLVTLGLRLFPLSTASSMTRSWYSMPLWLAMGWAFALAGAALATAHDHKKAA